MEGKYANSLCKKGKLNLVFLMMDKSYTTHSENSIDGWLAFMIGDALWYPLWDSNQIDYTAKEIIHVLGSKGKLQEGRQAPDSPATTKIPSLVSPSSNNIENEKKLNAQPPSTPLQSITSPNQDHRKLLILQKDYEVLQKDNDYLKQETIQLKQEITQIKKDLAMSRAFTLLLDKKKVKSNQLLELEEYLDNEGIDDANVLSSQSKDSIEILAKFLKPAYSTMFKKYMET